MAQNGRERPTIWTRHGVKMYEKAEKLGDWKNAYSRLVLAPPYPDFGPVESQHNKEVLRGLYSMQKTDWCRAIVAATWLAGYETEPGYCQRFVRQVCARNVVSKETFQRGGSAIEAALSWARDGRFVVRGGQSVPGDILYWTRGHGKYGHVAFRVYGNFIVENSVRHARRLDARFYHPIQSMDAPDLIVRIVRP